MNKPPTKPEILKLKDRRIKAGITRPQLEKVSGYNAHQFYHWEAGYQYPKKQILIDWKESLERMGA